MKELAEPLRREIERLPGHYEVRHRAVMDQVVLTARVRSVPVVMYLDTKAYPFTPPRLELAAGWSWDRRGLGRGRKIRGLDCLERWNRTLGIVALLRELEKRFREQPPARSQRATASRENESEAGRREERFPTFRALVNWWKALVGRLTGSARRARRRAEPASGLATPETIRARYDRVIRDKSSQVQRYQQAVTELVTLGQQKAARLSELREEVRQLAERERRAMAEAKGEVERQKGLGKTVPEIRADAGYRRRQAAFEERSAELEELQRRSAELEADTEEHLLKVGRHEAQLEVLVDEVEALKAEAAEMVTDMTLTQLEKEILDVRAGITKAGSGAELESLRRQLRKARAVVKVTREATDLEVEDRDERYLEVARRVEAAKRFDDVVGLEEPSLAEAARRDEAREP